MEVFAIVGWLLCSVLCAVVAKRKGRNGCGWSMLGILLGPFGLALASVVSNGKSIADVADVPEVQPGLEESELLTTTLHSEVTEACKRADMGLWDAFARSAGYKPVTPLAGRLVFPQYRDGRLRVSEQEARFAFIEALSQGPLRYSVEAPTSKLYSFSGTRALSAMTDPQLHDESEIGICNVEFKAKRVSSSAQDNSRIYKDVQKLLREPVWGLWFHLLEDINNSTLINFLDVMIRQIEKVQSDFGRDVEAPGLTLHICGLQNGFSLQKDVPFPLDEIIDIAELGRHLSIDDRNLNGWALHRRRVATDS